MKPGRILLTFLAAWTLLSALVPQAALAAPTLSANQNSAPPTALPHSISVQDERAAPNIVAPPATNALLASYPPRTPATPDAGDECIPVIFVPGITGSPNTFPFNTPEQPLFRLLEANGYEQGKSLFRFSYNWLGSNNTAAANLASYVETVKDGIESRIGVRPEHVSIIAHSMGGFVTRIFLSGHQSDVDKVVTIGSPYAGSVEMIARGTRWSSFLSGPGQLLPTWQAVFDPAGNPIANNAGYGYNPWVQSNVWGAPQPDIAFYSTQYDTAHTVTRTEYEVWDPEFGPRTEYRWDRRDFIPGDETVDRQSAVTSVGSTRIVGGNHAGAILSFNRGGGGVVESAAPQVLSHLRSSSRGGPENCYPYKLEIKVTPPQTDIPACVPVNFEVKVLNRDTGEPVQQLRSNEEVEIKIRGAAFDRETTQRTTQPVYSGTTPSVKRPGDIVIDVKVLYRVVTPRYSYTDTRAKDVEYGSVGLKSAPTRRDRCGRLETATFDEARCDWKWPNSNTPCLPDDNRSPANPGAPTLTPSDGGSGASIAVLGNGFDAALLDLLRQLGFQADRIAPEFSPEIVQQYPVLAIPSGGLSGYAQSTLMRDRLDRYVANGGVIVAFAQEYGREFALLPGGPIQAYGYDEDINCQANSTRIVTFAPMLLSQPREVLSINVDGFFTDWPRDADVLLSRTANGMPAMLTYRLGAGYVLATSSYADMARVQGQGTSDELLLVRDLMTWALNPTLDLDRYGPTDIVTIPLTATNATTGTTAFIDFAIANQEGDWVVSSDAIPAELTPGETRVLSTTIPMAELLSRNQGQHGQWRVGVGLLDASGQAVTSQAETYRFASARFTEAESGHGYPGQPYALSVTSESEEYPYNSPATFTYNVFNHSNQDRTFRVSWTMIHHSWYDVPGYRGEATIAVPAHSFRTVDGLLDRVVDLDRVRATLYLDGHQVAYAERGFWVVPAQLSQSIAGDKSQYNWGDSPTITVTTTNQANTATPVVANLSAFYPDGSIILTRTLGFTVTPAAPYVTAVSLPALNRTGQYRVAVDNLVYGRLAQRSSRTFSLAPLRARVAPGLPTGIAPGIPITLTTTNVGSGVLPAPTVQISLTHPSGTELWAEERSLPSLNPGQSDVRSLTLDIAPIDALGNYTLAYRVISAGQSLGKGRITLPASLALSAVLDQGQYRIRESATLSATLANTGRFDLASSLAVSSTTLALNDVQVLNLEAGDSDTRSYSIALPDSLPAGSHAIDVIAQVGGSSSSRRPTVVIPPARVIPTLDMASATAGQEITVDLANPGGVDAPIEASLALVDRFGSTIAEHAETPTIPAGASIDIGLTIPTGAVSGDYVLSLTGRDTAADQNFGLRRELAIAGVSGLLTVHTDQPAYFSDQEITALATLNPTGIPIANGSVDLKICTPVPPVAEPPPTGEARTLPIPAVSAPTETTDSARPDGSPKNRNETRTPAGADLTEPGYVTFTPISGNPLQVNVANDASYQVIYNSEVGTPGQVYWTYGNTADAGIFLWYDGYAIGPDFANHWDYSASNWYDVWTTLGQSPVTGEGTRNNPWTVETSLLHAPSGASLTTRNSYVNGDQYFRIDWDICLPHPAQVSTFLAADYYLQGSDYGYGLYDPVSGSVGGYNQTLDWFQIFTPIRPATHYYEASYWQIWDAIGSAGAPGYGFNDTLVPYSVDNGAGLQWDLYVNGCTTVSAFWSFGETPTIPPVVPPYQDSCGYVLWDKTVPVSTTAPLDLSELAGTLDVTGRLLLWGRANSSTGQPFASDTYSFYVHDRDTALTLETDRAIYRPGDDVQIAGVVTNTSTLTQALTLVVSANQAALLELPLELAPGESAPYSASTLATIPLTLTATAANAEVQAVPVVANPQAQAMLIAPDVASRAPFSVTLVVSNTGIVPATIAVTLAGHAEPSWVLQPGQTAQTQQTVQITDDTVISAVLAGDLATTLSKTVVLGERSDLALAAPADPVWAGLVSFPYTLTNTGLLPTTVPLVFVLDNTPVLQREVTVMPGQALVDALNVELAPGAHELAAHTAYEQESVSAVALVRDLVEVSIDQVIAPAEMAGRTPISATLSNTGTEPVRGSLLIQTGFDLADFPFELAVGETRTVGTSLDSTLAPEAGTFSLDLQAWSGGALLDEAQQPIVVPAASWSLEPPGEWMLVPGADVTATYRVRNTGGLGAPFTLVLDLDGLYDDVQNGWANPGQDVPVTFQFTVPADLEERDGAGRTILNGAETPFTYRIAGYDLDMTGRLSLAVAEPGDPVQVIVDVVDRSGQGRTIPLVVRLTGVGDEQLRPISLTHASQVVFDIAAPAQDALLSYGLYNPTGRSLLLDTLRLYVIGEANGQRPLGVFPDRTVYSPGDTVHLTAVSHVAGRLELRILGVSHSLMVQPNEPTTIDVPLPADLLAGSYQAAYHFASVDGREVDDAAAFEVDGDRAAIRDVALDIQATGCAGQVGATVKIDSRTELPGVTITWQVIAPDGQAVSVEQSLDGDLSSGLTWWTLPGVAFSSNQAGPHQLILRLMQGQRELASGFQVFDLGGTALLGIALPQGTYREGAPISATASLINNGTGPALLSVQVDGQPWTTRQIHHNGYVVESLALGALGVGDHTLTALLAAGDACSSQAEARLTVAPRPVLEIIADQPAGLQAWHVVTPTIYLRAEDSVSTIVSGFYAWDNGPQRPYDDNALFVPSDGARVLSAQVTAADGATSDVVTRTIRIDRVAPDITAVVEELPSIRVTLVATDTTSGVDWSMFRIDGAEWISYTAPIPIAATQPTSVTIDYKARDVAGNWSAVKTTVITVTVVACELYPIALHEATVAGLPPGTALTNILNGSGPGNFGWLSWAGSSSAVTLAHSLTPPGDSTTYVNPADPQDHTVSVGDWVRGVPGVNNSSAIRAALNQLIGRPIVVPVWSETQGQGSNVRYRVVGYAQIALTSYSLPSRNRISASYLGPVACSQ